ncbi:TPA: hypothetical protein ACVO1H_004079 [Vibrio diabolicus]
MKRKRFHDEIFGLDVICSFLGCVFLVLFYVGDFFVEAGISNGLVGEYLNFINSKQSVVGKKSTTELGQRIREQ